MKNIALDISNIISDYRDGEFGLLDVNHVLKWVYQFEESDREVVLLETKHILERNYITRENFNQFISGLSKNQNLVGSCPKEFWSKVSILEIQQHGNSQNELNILLKKIIFNEHNVNVSVNNSNIKTFIYLDDFLFSGNRFVNDISRWLESCPDKCQLFVISIGWYEFGKWQTETKLRELLKRIGKNVDIQYLSYKDFRLENRLAHKSYSHVLWPIENVKNDLLISGYITKKNCTPKYRIENEVENNVFSIQRRSQFELAMLRAGIKILSFCNETSAVVKPLGYGGFDFGFGSTVFTFRNCPNNNPLAYWWGNPNADKSHPFSKWYPLMQRKTYYL